MDFDPSRDWDRHCDQMERSARDEHVGRLVSTALPIYAALQASALSSRKFTTNTPDSMEDKLIAYWAFSAAVEFIRVTESLDYAWRVRGEAPMGLAANVREYLEDGA